MVLWYGIARLALFSRQPRHLQRLSFRYDFCPLVSNFVHGTVKFFVCLCFGAVGGWLALLVAKPAFLSHSVVNTVPARS